MIEENLKILNYSKLWLDNEVLTLETLQTQVNEFKIGEDTNKEHYRFRTFKNYLQTHPSLTDNEIARLFDIMKTEADYSAATSMGLAILKIQSLNDGQFELVADRLKSMFSDDSQKYIDKERERRQKRD